MRRVLPLVLIVLAPLAACKPKEPLTDAERAAAVSSLPAPYNSANVENGKSIFQQCKSCHTIGADGANMTGPNLFDVVGRTAGTHKDYSYSDALKTAGFAWDAEHLDKWLENPRGYRPGTKMSFVGLKTPQERIDVIGYLRTQSDKKPGA